MSRLEELFVDNKFHPVDDRGNPLDELLAISLQKETKTQSKQLLSIGTFSVGNHKMLLSMG